MSASTRSIAARYVTGEEPIEVTAIVHEPTEDPRFREVHESVAFTIALPVRLYLRIATVLSARERAGVTQGALLLMAGSRWTRHYAIAACVCG